MILYKVGSGSRVGSGSIVFLFGSEVPDPNQNKTDPKPCWKGHLNVGLEGINTGQGRIENIEFKNKLEE